MDSNNTFDWVAVQLQNGNSTFNDLNAMGVDASATTLQSADFYKEQPKIKDMFKTATGGFDDKKFDDFYLNSKKTFNQYKSSDKGIENATTDLWDDTSMARNLGMNIRRDPVTVSLASKDPFTNLKQAQGSFYGITEINKWSAPTMSIREVSKQQNVRDGLTGKLLDYTPQDTSLFNAYGFFNEPLVQAAYDKDERDASGKIIHKRGELKFDDKGLPYYETLAGRDPAGKDILSRSDTLTKMGSFWHKYDFMSSDGLDKSITGTIVKSAVQAAPMLIGGPLGLAYTAYYIGSGLVDGSAEILKAVDGITNGPDAKNDGLYKWANSLQGYTGQWKSSSSDYAKQHAFSLETLLGQAVDSLYQLKSQKAIVEWPLEYTKYQMAKKLGLETEGILNIGQKATDGLYDIEKYAAKYGSDWKQSAIALSQNVDKLHKYETYAQNISRAYMAATSAVGISQAAKEAGLDARDQGFLYAGYTAALFGLFGTEYAHFVEERIGGLDDFAKGANNMLTAKAKAYLPAIAEELSKTATGPNTQGRALKMLASGKELGKMVLGGLKSGLNALEGLDARSALGSSLKEGFEEITEQSIQDGLQLVYNGFSAAGLTSTQDKQATFNMDPAEIAQDIAMNGVGGVLGGLVFHYADPHHNHVFSSDKLADYIIGGYTKQVQDRITDMKDKGQFGDTKLSITPLTDLDGQKIDGMYEPVSAQFPVSQNDFIADNISKSVQVLEALKDEFNVVNPKVTLENKAKFYQNIVDPGTDTDLERQLNQTISDIFKKSSEIQSIDGLDKETNEGMLKKKAELKELQTRLEYLQGDESMDEFFVQGLFNIRTDVNEAFGVKNKETLAQELAGVPYNKLNQAQKGKIDDAYNAYRDDQQNGLASDLRAGAMSYKHFNDVMESKGGYREIDAYKESLEHLRKFVLQKNSNYVPDGETEPVAQGVTYALTNDYLEKLAGVKYVPDFIFDFIKGNVNNTASLESNELLKTLAVNNDVFKKESNSLLREGLNDEKQPLIKEYIQKLMGDKNFNEFLDSEAYKDIQNNKIPNSNYSTLSLLKNLSQLRETVDLSKMNEQKALIQQVEQIDDAQLGEFLDSMDNGEMDKKNPLYDVFNQFKGFFDFVEGQQELGLQSDSFFPVFTPKGLKAFIEAKQIATKLGKDITHEELDGLINTLSDSTFKNIYLDLLHNGEYKVANDVVYAATLNQTDDNLIKQSLEILTDFDNKRLASPIKKVLEVAYQFEEAQTEAIKAVGISNYVNSDPAFMAAFDTHLHAIEKVTALINAAATMNPIINDFRSNHKGIIGDENKDTILSILEDSDAATLAYELSRLKKQIKYLKDVNYYNSNNLLTRLLKEDGYELVSKVKTLQEIATDDRVTELLPTLSRIEQIESINNYVNTYKTATADEKAEALYQLAKFEDSVFMDMNKLSEGEKIEIVNRTFSAITSEDTSFYDNINPELELNDAHKTLYLATIFGSSSLDFYKRYAGAEDTENGEFVNLAKSEFIPFAKQENAVRLFNLIHNGDRNIVTYLFNANTYNDTTESIDFSKPSSDDIVGSTSMMSVFGSPGTGKTSAVLAMIMNMSDDTDANTLILAPKERQLDGLKGSLIKSGYESRIDPRSAQLKEFLNNLGLVDQNGVAIDFNGTDKYFQTTQPTDEEIKKGAVYEGEPSTNDLEVAAQVFSNYIEVPSLADPSKGIIDKLNLYNKGKFNPQIANMLSGLRTIVLDEFTHVNPVDLAILADIITKYNMSASVQADPNKRITIVNLGDNNQLGYTNITGQRRDFTSMATTIISQPLTASLRQAWDLLNNTLTDVTRRTLDIKQIGRSNKDNLVSSETIEQSRIPIELFHKSIEGSIGIKSIRSENGISASDLSFISDNQDKLTGKDVVYVVTDKEDIPRAQSLLSQAFGSDWASKAHIEIYTPDEVQGGEYKYAIIDAKPKLTGSSYDIVRTHEYLNTMLSRATEATLLVDNGSMDHFIRFNNNIKDKALKQIKITKEVTDKVKESKQKLLASILRDYVSADFKANVKRDNIEKKFIPVKPFNPILFNSPANVVEQGKAKVSQITAYTTFNTKDDFNKIFPFLKRPASKFEESQEDIEKIINSLKYYIMKEEQLGEGNIALRSNFSNYLQDYKYQNPTFFIEARKMNGDHVIAGRSEQWPDPDTSINSPVIYLKVKLANNDTSKEPLVLTMGTLNSLTKLKQKYKDTKAKLDDGDLKVNNFVNQLIEMFASGKAPTVGTAKDGVWTSKEYTKREWSEVSEIWSARMKYAPKAEYPFEKFQSIWNDFYITDPQVVVSAFVGEDGKPVLDRDGKNPKYRQAWKDLSGRAISFMSEYKELQTLNADQMLDIFIKQLGFFNNEEFKNADKAGKQAIIDGITETINIPNVSRPIRYRPNMVQMIRLSNPTESFLNFRERYLLAISTHKKGTPIQELFANFDMSPYVKDRLIKSLLTIRQFLTTPDNRKWFTDNILSGQSDNAENTIKAIRQYGIDNFGETGEIDEDPNDKNSFSEVVLRDLGVIKSAEDFARQLDTLFDLKDEFPVLRNKYETDSNNPDSSARLNKKEPHPVTEADLLLNLTHDKHIDFSNSILDLNLFNLFKKTKSVNFAELIDKSLKVFGNTNPEELGLPNDSKLDKYRLGEVFKDGKIETIVTAAPSAVKGNKLNNILADVRFIGKTFKFGFGGMQQPAYNLDFDKIIDSMSNQSQPITKDMANELYRKFNEIYDKLNDIFDVSDWETGQEILELNEKVADLAKVGDVEAAYEALLKVMHIVENLNENVPVEHDEPLTGDSVVNYYVSKNGEIPYTVDADIMKDLIENTPGFEKETHETIKLDYQDSTNEEITYIATNSEDEQFKLVYNSKLRSAKVDRMEYQEQEFSEEFDSLKGDLNLDHKELWLKAVKSLGVKYLSINPKAIATVDDMTAALGKELEDVMTYEQQNLLVPNGFGFTAQYSEKTYRQQLAKEFIRRLADDPDFINKALKVVHDDMEHLHGTALSVDAEKPYEDSEDGFGNLVKKDGKQKQKIDPMDKLRQDLKSVNDKTKQEFEHLVREIFDGKQNDKPVSDWVKNFELINRAGIVKKTLATANEKLSEPVALNELGGFDDISTVDTVKLMNDTMDIMQGNRLIFNPLKPLFAELNRETIKKLKGC